jgi:two-component system cell cycle sensor histidine kinase/response regulator CckA
MPGTRDAFVGEEEVPMDMNVEQLRTLGTLTAGVAHDMRNVLNGLYLRLQLLEKAVAAKDESIVSETLGQMRQDIQVGTQLLQRVQNFARPDDTHPTFVDLDAVVSEACTLAWAHTNEGRRVTIEQDRGAPPRVVGWQGELVVAVLNLVMNAIDATPIGQRVTVRTSTIGGRSCVEVQDRGAGMPPDVVDRMCEPFFTTKGKGGSGLGLASVAQCVDRHGAELRVRSAPGLGSSIGILFP